VNKRQSAANAVALLPTVGNMLVLKKCARHLTVRKKTGRRAGRPYFVTPSLGYTTRSAPKFQQLSLNY